MSSSLRLMLLDAVEFIIEDAEFEFAMIEVAVEIVKLLFEYSGC